MVRGSYTFPMIGNGDPLGLAMLMKMHSAPSGEQDTRLFEYRRANATTSSAVDAIKIPCSMF